MGKSNDICGSLTDQLTPKGLPTVQAASHVVQGEVSLSHKAITKNNEQPKAIGTLNQ